MTHDRERLEEQRDQAVRDLVDLDRQVAAGELPSDIAAGLRSRYEHTAAEALARLAEAPRDTPRVPDRPSGRGRWAAYGIALAVALFAAVVLLPIYLGDRVAGGAVSGNEALASGSGPDTAPRDLSTVTNEEMEAVIAENPEVIDMRLALAHRYLDAGEYLGATRHYLVVLDREPRNVEAQAHQGWLLMQLGDPQQAMDLISGALEQDPQHAEALWFQASIALYGLSDPATAVAALERLQQRTDLEPEVRTQVNALLAAARGQEAAG